MKKILKYVDIEECRKTPNKSLLLFLTDKCPVGCRHCSVNSREFGPSISNRRQFELIVEEICNLKQLECVGISGGEPFVEKWGLLKAMDRLYAAKKNIVIYTSGVWAKNQDVPKWINDVLEKASSIILSTDIYHQEKIPEAQLINCLRAFADAHIWTIIQILNDEIVIEGVKDILLKVFGKNWKKHAELNLIYPLQYGRGKKVFSSLNYQYSIDHFGFCNLLYSPTIRYDGVVSACCNEAVLMGYGSERLRGKLTDNGNLESILNEFASDEINQMLCKLPIKDILSFPHFAELQFGDKKFNSICEICWIIQDYVKEHPIDNRLRLILHSLSKTLK